MKDMRNESPATKIALWAIAIVIFGSIALMIYAAATGQDINFNPDPRN